MKITPLLANTFTSDGGAMFGFVPKPVWSKRLATDELNRIPQHAHCLLVELADGRKGLVDTGCGPAERFSEVELKRSGLGSGWPLMDGLARCHTVPADIAFVICTHLHWDHGGGLIGGRGDDFTCAFPNATLYVHQQEWEDATISPEILYKSYPRDLIAAIRTHYEARLNRVNGDEATVVPGISLVRSGGHTRGHCVVVLTAEEIALQHPRANHFAPLRRAVFAGDVCPMQQNLPMVYQTAYDTFPLDTRAWKRTWLPQIAAEKTLLFFDHDPLLFGATIVPDAKREFIPHTLLSADGELPK